MMVNNELLNTGVEGIKDPFTYYRKFLETWVEENVMSLHDIKKLDQRFADKLSVATKNEVFIPE